MVDFNLQYVNVVGGIVIVLCGVAVRIGIVVHYLIIHVGENVLGGVGDVCAVR